MKTSKTVLVLGAGVGGIVATNTLKKLLSPEDKIIIFDKEKNHIFSPSLLWLMTGDRKVKNISRPIENLTSKGVEVVRGEIEKIDPILRSVVVNGKTYIGDAIIISLGAELDAQSIHGLDESGYNLYTLEGAQKINDIWKDFTGGKIAIMTAAPAYKCPAAPYEAALLIDYHVRQLGLKDKTEISIYAAEPGPMLTAGQELSSAVKQMVEQRGVKYFPNHQIKYIDQQNKNLVFTNEVTATFDHLIYIPPHKAPQVVKTAGLLNDSGWISVDRHKLTTSFSSVFAIGDITIIPLKTGRPLPKAGVFAHAQAEVVAQNIAADWYHKLPQKNFDGFGQCFIEIGHHRAGMGKGNFYAEPLPQIETKKPSIFLHFGKIMFEKYWFMKWF